VNVDSVGAACWIEMTFNGTTMVYTGIVREVNVVSDLRT